MKKIVLLLFLGWVMAAFAQEKAEIIVSYEYSFPIYSKNNSLFTVKMSLLANSAKAKYFNEISQWSDSLTSTPGGAEKLRDIIRKSCLVVGPDGSVSVDLRRGPSKSVYTYIYTDTQKGTLDVYDRWAGELGHYTEPLDEQVWEIVEDSTATVLGYECLMARSDYHGRQWTAWFTPEIPVPFGPWKFRGLPGLVLKAENAEFSFTATGLETTDREMTPMYAVNDYPNVDRKKVLSDNEYYCNNIQSIAQAQTPGGKITIKFTDDDGNEIIPPKYTAERNAVEPDYK